jgi:hypothetical protein
MAPPSNLKLPASMGYRFIGGAKYEKRRNMLKALRDY